MAPDEIIFHDDGIYEFKEMADFDRIIVCGGKDENYNVTIVSKLLVSAPVSHPIYIYAPSGDIVTNLFGSNRLICFGTAKETASAEISGLGSMNFILNNMAECPGNSLIVSSATLM